YRQSTTGCFIVGETDIVFLPPSTPETPLDWGKRLPRGPNQAVTHLSSVRRSCPRTGRAATETSLTPPPPRWRRGAGLLWNAIPRSVERRIREDGTPDQVPHRLGPHGPLDGARA